MTERGAKRAVDDRLRLDTGAKAIERRSQDGGKLTVQLSDITKEKEEMQIEALKEALRGAKGNVWRREYHFRSDVDDNAPSAL